VQSKVQIGRTHIRTVRRLSRLRLRIVMKCKSRRLLLCRLLCLCAVHPILLLRVFELVLCDHLIERVYSIHGLRTESVRCDRLSLRLSVGRKPRSNTQIVKGSLRLALLNRLWLVRMQLLRVRTLHRRALRPRSRAHSHADSHFMVRLRGMELARRRSEHLRLMRHLRLHSSRRLRQCCQRHARRLRICVQCVRVLLILIGHVRARWRLIRGRRLC